MGSSRRDFLKSLCACAGGSMISRGLWGYGEDSGLAFAQGMSCAASRKVVVSIFLSGGPHGLSILVPRASQPYVDKHPTLAVTNSLALDSLHGLNPAMPQLHGLYQQGKVVLMNGGGYPNHSRSHEDSTNFMGRATIGNGADTTGWAGRFARTYCAPDELFSLFSFRGKVSEITAPGITAPTASSLSSYSYSNDGQGTPANNYVRQIVRENRARAGVANSHQTEMFDAWEAGEEALTTIQTVNSGYTGGPTYPNTSIAQRLRDAAKLIISPVISTRLIFVSLGGFDTHGQQASTLTTLLGQLDAALGVFWSDMVARGKADDVVVLAYGEFGRTFENNNQGTDHGTGTFVMMLGNNVRGSVPIQYADSDFTQRNNWIGVKFDYREVLEQVFTRHLAVDAGPVLPQSFNRVGLNLFT